MTPSLAAGHLDHEETEVKVVGTPPGSAKTSSGNAAQVGNAAASTPASSPPSSVASSSRSSADESATTTSSAAAPVAQQGEEDELTVTKSLHVRRDWYSTIATFIAGGVAGAASRTLTAPLDRIKLIVQEGHLVQAPTGAVKAAADACASGGTAAATSASVGGGGHAAAGAAAAHRTHPSLLQVARLIKADGGWQSFWRGNVINCFKAGPEFAIVFSIRRYLSSLYEDCVEREKRRRKRSIARWKEHDERSNSISRREEEERVSMLGAPTSSDRRTERISSAMVSDGNKTSSSRSSSNSTSSEDDGLLSENTNRHAEAHAKTTSSSSASLDWPHLSGQELRERERVISAEASIFTPPFNRIGCLCSIPQLAINCTIGAIAGLGAQGILYPLEVVKTRAVVSRSNEYTGGVREIVRLGYKRGGIMEFYKGFAPNMVGIVVYRGLEMGLYSSAQQSIMLYRMQVLKMNRHDASLNAAEVGVVGMFASTVAQTVSYPLNVIRTRLQTQGTNGRAKKYNGMVDCCVKMIRNKGVTSLFSGLTANYLKAVPASACTFVVFEWAQRLLVGDD